MLHSIAMGLGRQQGRELVGILIELGSIRDGQNPFDCLINGQRVGDIPNLKPFLHPTHPEFPLIFRLENPSCLVSPFISKAIITNRSIFLSR